MKNILITIAVTCLLVGTGCDDASDSKSAAILALSHANVQLENSAVTNQAATTCGLESVSSGYKRDVALIFLGMFGRAPKPDGLDYWAGKMATDGKDRAMYDMVRSGMMNGDVRATGYKPQSALYTALILGAPTAYEAEMSVSHMYVELFRRGPSVAERDFWRDEILDQNVWIATLADAVAKAATGTDLERINIQLDWIGRAVYAQRNGHQMSVDELRDVLGHPISASLSRICDSIY